MRRQKMTQINRLKKLCVMLKQAEKYVPKEQSDKWKKDVKLLLKVMKNDR